MISRIDQLDSAPVVMRYYLVPTVRYPMHGRVETWPVMGVRHTDAKHLEFPWRHFHFDHRFFTPTQFAWLFENGFQPVHLQVHARVLSEYTDAPPPGFPELPLTPIWMRKRCYREALPYPHYHMSTTHRGPHKFPSLWKSLRGRQAKRNAAGHWVCPHRQFALGSVPCVNGVITCPLHGLRINATTGAVETEGYFEKAA